MFPICEWSQLPQSELAPKKTEHNVGSTTQSHLVHIQLSKNQLIKKTRDLWKSSKDHPETRNNVDIIYQISKYQQRTLTEAAVDLQHPRPQEGEGEDPWLGLSCCQTPSGQESSQLTCTASLWSTREAWSPWETSEISNIKNIIC